MTRGTVTLTPIDRPGDRVVFLRTGEDTLTGGLGGWESLPRPRRSAAAGWVGGPEQTLELPLLLDGMEVSPGVDVSVEASCRQLASYGLPGGEAQPSVLKITGSSMASASSRWVLQEITWGERVRNASGRRVQQALTVRLLRYVEPRLVSSPAERSRRHRGRPSAQPWV